MTEVLDHTKHIVNGPLNVVRLEGEIDGIKKVMYCYMDIHLSPNSQTENENVFSTDVAKHLADNFIKLNNGKYMVDFFMEVNPSDLNKNQNMAFKSLMPQTNTKNKYIIQVMKLFKKSFKLSADKKVLQSDTFKNTRFHYADIRDCLFINMFSELAGIADYLSDTSITKASPFLFGSISSSYLESMRVLDILDNYLIRNDKIETSNKKTPDNSKINEIIRKFDDILKKALDGVLAEKAKKLGPTDPVDPAKPVSISMFDSGIKANIQRRIKLFNKYFNKYSHESVKSNIADLLTDIRRRIGGLITLIKESQEILRYYQKEFNSQRGKITFDPDMMEHTLYEPSHSFLDKMTSELQTRHSKITYEFLHILSAMMDIYTIRRFADKDYITNAVYYSGAAHSCNTIFWLCKHFNFKITHAGNINEKEIAKINSKISSLSYPEMLTPMLFPPRLNQSTDMSNMPDNYM